MDKNYNFEEPKFEIKPKFNLIYEMGMPTGRKIKSTAMTFVIFVAIYVLFFFAQSEFGGIPGISIDLNKLSFVGTGILILMVIIVLKLAFHIAFQMLQYKNISYTFYDEFMVYEDKFLNQHKKTIRYENIKEVEIRRRIWDRMLGYGVIIIYTSAENNNSNGLILYAIKDPQKKYDDIQEILYTYKNKEKEAQEKISDKEVRAEIQDEINEEKQSSEDFINDLKNLNN